MKKCFFLLSVLFAFSAVAAAPIDVMVIGQNIRAASPFLETFKEACAKEGINVHFELHPPAINFDRVPLELMKKFHVIVFHGIPESQSSTKGDAVKFRENLEKYRQAGGGILWTPMLMMPHSDGWNPTLGKQHGMKLIEEKIVDPSNAVDIAPELRKETYRFLHTTNITPNPVTEGVRGLLLPNLGEWSWPGTVAMDYSPDWTILVRAMPSAKTIGNAGRSSAKPDFREDLKGSVDSAPALVAIRDGKNGQGNMAVYPFYSAHTFQNFGGPAFNDAMMLNGFGDRKSDGYRLFTNLVRYLAPPAQKAKLGGYVFAEPRKNLPVRGAMVWSDNQWNPVSLTDHPAESKRFRGAIGPASSFGGGKSTVKEYAEAAKKGGLDFLVFIDDGAKHTEATYAAFVKACAEASGPDILLLPGVEFRDSWGLPFFLIAPSDFPNPKLLKAPGVVADYWGMVMKLHYGGIGLHRMAKAPYDPYWVMWTYQIMPTYYENGKIHTEDWAKTIEIQAETHAYVQLGGLFAKSAAELLQALKTAPLNVVAADKLESIQPFLTRRGTASTYPNFITTGPEISRWSTRNGTANHYQEGHDRVRVEIGAKSPKGLKEIKVIDGVSGETVRRFLFNGEKEFKTMFYLAHTNRKMLELFVTDVDGGVASGAHMNIDNAANRLTPMGDRLMGMHHSAQPDPKTGSRGSWGGWTGGVNWTKRRNEAGSYTLAGNQQELRIFGYDGGKIFSGAIDVNPILQLDVKNREPFLNGFHPRHRFASENFVRMDYIGREEFTAPFKNEEIISSLPRPTEFADITTSVWSIYPRSESPVAVNVHRQTVEFKKDVEIREYRAMSTRRWQVDSGRHVYIRDAAGTVAEILPRGGAFSRKGVLRPGDYLYPANEIGGAVGLINLGPGELQYRTDARAAQITLPGGKFKKGDKLEVNIMTFGRDARPELQNQDAWLIKYIDDFGIGKDKPGFPTELKQGKPWRAPFGLGAEAVDGGAVFTVGKADLPHDMPLTVRVPQANAVYGHYSGRDNTLQLLEPLEGELHSAIDTRRGADTLYMGEIVSIDNLLLRLDAALEPTAAMLLEIHNPTDTPQSGSFTVRKFFTAPEKLTLRPGESKIIKLQAKPGSFKLYARP